MSLKQDPFGLPLASCHSYPWCYNVVWPSLVIRPLTTSWHCHLTPTVHHLKKSEGDLLKEIQGESAIDCRQGLEWSCLSRSLSTELLEVADARGWRRLSENRIWLFYVLGRTMSLLSMDILTDFNSPTHNSSSFRCIIIRTSQNTTTSANNFFDVRKWESLLWNRNQLPSIFYRKQWKE